MASSRFKIELSRRNLLLGSSFVGAVACGVYALIPDKKSGSTPRTSEAPVVDHTPAPVISDTLTVGSTKVNHIDGAEMMWIPEGTFQMGGKLIEGSRGKEKDRMPVHLVNLPGYWMYKTPVTVKQYRRYDDARGKIFNWEKFQPKWGWQDDHPMVQVNWVEAYCYAHWVGTTLPTEAQWEKAARGGLQGKTYAWGNVWDGSRCANSVKPNILNSTTPVDSYPTNAYGLYDMAGNVWEWCSDWYDDHYYASRSANEPEPVGPEFGSNRVVRGGSWNNRLQDTFRCAKRNFYDPEFKCALVGFRCCLRPPGPVPVSTT